MSEVACRLPRALGVLGTRRWPWPAVRVCEVAPAPAAERAGSCPSARASVSLVRGDRLTLRPVDVKPRTRPRVHAAAVDRALARVPGPCGAQPVLCRLSHSPRPRARRCPGRDTGRKARVTGPRPGWCHEGKPAPRTHGGAVWCCVTRLPAHGALSGPGPGPSVDAQESRSGASPQHPEACEGPWPGRAWRVAGRVTRGVRRCQPGPGGGGSPGPGAAQEATPAPPAQPSRRGAALRGSRARGPGRPRPPGPGHRHRLLSLPPQGPTPAPSTSSWPAGSAATSSSPSPGRRETCDGGMAGPSPHPPPIPSAPCLGAPPSPPQLSLQHRVSASPPAPRGAEDPAAASGTRGSPPGPTLSSSCRAEASPARDAPSGTSIKAS